MKTIVHRFQSVGELSRHLAAAKLQGPFRSSCEDTGEYNFSSYSTTEKMARWSATESYEQADSLLLYGDRMLQQKIEAAGVSQMRTKLKQHRNRRQLCSAVVGIAPNVPNFVAGAPTNMIAVHQVRAKQPVLTFMYNTSVPSGVSAEKIIAATAKLVAALLVIEASGIRINLYAGEVCKKDGHYCCWSVRIKDSGQMIDTLKMSYPLAHPSMLRRQWFRLMETTPGVPSSYVDGYGRVVNNEVEAQKALRAAGITNIDRVLSYGNIDHKTAEEIAKELTENGGAK